MMATGEVEKLQGLAFPPVGNLQILEAVVDVALGTSGWCTVAPDSPMARRPRGTIFFVR